MLERRNRELRQASQILRKAALSFALAELDRHPMITFIGDHRETYGVESICKVLPIVPSTYHSDVVKRRDPAELFARAGQDAALKIKSRCVFEMRTSELGRASRLSTSQREDTMLPVARCRD